MVSGDVLIENAQRLHTTERGAERIRRNLRIETPDVAAWCRSRILDGAAKIGRRGKNWYADCGGCRITVNAGSYTIITAHPIGRRPCEPSPSLAAREGKREAGQQADARNRNRNTEQERKTETASRTEARTKAAT